MNQYSNYKNGDDNSGLDVLVIGVGGGGNNSINRLSRIGVYGARTIAVNTDKEHLNNIQSDTKMLIGKDYNRGLGTGGDPDIGMRCAESAYGGFKKIIGDSDLVFITAGMGGGTGTGAIPVISEIARDLGALTVGVVTKPFPFELHKRKVQAEEGIKKLKEKVDTLIVIPNERLLQLADKKTSILDAFRMVDDVLHQGVQGISDLITVPGIINLDFADVKTIMEGTGTALMGVGVSSEDNRAEDAANRAITSPLLETTISGAQGILINITGGENLGLFEVHEAADIISSHADSNANIIFGAVIDDSMNEEIRVTVIATGFDRKAGGHENVVEADFQKTNFDEDGDIDTPAFMRRKKEEE